MADGRHFVCFYVVNFNMLGPKEKMSKIKKFGIFGISTSKIFRKCLVQAEILILQNLLNTMRHPTLAPESYQKIL